MDHEEVAQLPERQKKHQQDQAAVDAHWAEWRKIEEEHLRVAQTLGEAAQESQRAVGRSYNALSNLRRNYKGPLLQTLAQTHQRQQQLADELQGLQGQRQSIRNDLFGPVRKLVSIPRQTIDRLEANLAKVEKEIERVQSAIAQCGRQAAEIEQQIVKE